MPPESVHLALRCLRSSKLHSLFGWVLSSFDLCFDTVVVRLKISCLLLFHCAVLLSQSTDCAGDLLIEYLSFTFLIVIPEVYDYHFPCIGWLPSDEYLQC